MSQNLTQEQIAENTAAMLKDFDDQVKEEIDLEKLSPDYIIKPTGLTKDGKQLASKKKSMMEGMEDHFTCHICQKVVLDPKECNQCQTPFCSKCID